ncbi:hypothetical protein O6H91_09G113400 [Diphasiastrum complanatum]|uniref:Uncharacterized protein n=1 Tax=Diphasiastrum complanatum TaxID=34168 RepID=A0ACC2CTS3_DIPCM|nr:hypothetical protein O6H91_09G113400 [Diphasiastrum complanatum]
MEHVLLSIYSFLGYFLKLGKQVLIQGTRIGKYVYGIGISVSTDLSPYRYFVQLSLAIITAPLSRPIERTIVFKDPRKIIQIEKNEHLEENPKNEKNHREKRYDEKTLKIINLKYREKGQSKK